MRSFMEDAGQVPGEKCSGRAGPTTPVDFLFFCCSSQPTSSILSSHLLFSSPLNQRPSTSPAGHPSFLHECGLLGARTLFCLPFIQLAISVALKI